MEHPKWNIQNGTPKIQKGAYEKCQPTSQTFPELVQNMMTPRCGHSVTSRSEQGGGQSSGSNVYIYGGGTDGFVEDSEMYCFDLDTFVWTRMQIDGPIPPGRYNHAACMARGSVANKIIISGGIGNVRPTEEDVAKYTRAMRQNIMTAPPNHMHDHVLNDVWTFDLSHNVWSQVGVPNMIPMYNHLMCTFDNKDTKLFLYGGHGNSRGSGDGNKKSIGHSIEIDLVPSWSRKHRRGKNKVNANYSSKKKAWSGK